MTNIACYKTPYKLGREVLGPSGIHGQYDEKAVDSPFVFWHNGRYHMMHVGFDGIGYQTALAASDDLLHWEKEFVMFPRGQQTGWDKGGVAGVWILKENDLHGRPTLKKWQGKYWLVYHSYPDAGYEAGPACIGLAYTTDETLREWIRLPEPILRWQYGAAWEQAGLYKGCLVEHQNKLYLFYNAKDSEEWLWHEQIGMATSEDMFNWTRCKDKPIIANTPNGWDSAFCADPCIVQDKDRWVMFYYGYNGEHAQEGIAFSEDLLHWKKENAPILCSGATGSLDELHAHKPSVIEKDGVLYHYYCAVRPGRQDDHAVNADPTQQDGQASEYRCISVATSAAVSNSIES